MNRNAQDLYQIMVREYRLGLRDLDSEFKDALLAASREYHRNEKIKITLCVIGLIVCFGLIVLIIYSIGGW